MPHAAGNSAVKILAVSNFYPPHFIGGYELGCRDVVDRLQKRGHEVRVLTSTYGVNRPVVEGHVYRWMRADPRGPRGIRGYVRAVRQAVANERALDRVLGHFHPDLIYIWNPRYSGTAICWGAERTGVPVVYYVSDSWLSQVEADPVIGLLRSIGGSWRLRLLRLVAAAYLRIGGVSPRGPLRLRLVHFCSRFLWNQATEAGVHCRQAEVIHWGVDLLSVVPATPTWRPSRLLYVGQIAEHKGFHTALEAFAAFARDVEPRATLTVAGAYTFPEYEERMACLIDQLGVADRIRFLGQLPRQQLAEVYAAHDVLIFPSSWNEPFSITLVEAMAAGLPVVTTLTGGTGEIARDCENVVVFPAGSSDGCTAAMRRLHEDHELFERIRSNARCQVIQSYDIEHMVDRIEQSLMKVIPNGVPASCSLTHDKV